MTARHSPVPFVLLVFGTLAAIAGAFYASVDVTLELFTWAPTESWKTPLRLEWDPTAAVFSIAVLLVATAAQGLSLKRQQPLFETGHGLLLFTLALLGLLFAITARGTLMLTLGWSIWIAASFALLARDPDREGGGVSWTRWLPLVVSCLALFCALITSFSVFHVTDLVEMARVSREPYEFPLETLSLAWVGALAAGILGAAVLPSTAPPKKTPSLLEPWWRITSLIAALLIPVRFGFLAGFNPSLNLLLVGIGVAVAAIFAGLQWWQKKKAGERTTVFSRSPVRLRHQAFTLFGAALDQVELKVWPELWRIPPQACRTLGTFFVYWQSGTPQYTVVILLFGTLLLFWAALKTQVIW